METSRLITGGENETQDIQKKDPRKSLYVATALTGADPDFVKDVMRFRNVLEQKYAKTYNILKFVGISPETSDAVVFEHDIACVEASDLVVGISDHKSTGLGWEMGWAARSGQMVLAVAHEDAHITKMVTGAGASDVAPSVHFERYTTLVEDVIPIVHQLLGNEHLIDMPMAAPDTNSL